MELELQILFKEVQIPRSTRELLSGKYLAKNTLISLSMLVRCKAEAVLALRFK
jgi:hypothetical protein